MQALNITSALSLYQYCLSKLGAIEERERIAMVYMLLEDGYAIDKTAIVLNKELKINFNEIDKKLSRLNKQEPIQYILGFTYFRNRKFMVSPDVLIPRPETEEIIDLVKKHMPTSAQVLEIGTGSGCIAISLALELEDAKITAIDISNPAIKKAEQNANLLGAQIDFKTKNFLSGIPKSISKWDIIVSNPPYIKKKEKCQMSSNVLDFEPDLALFVEDDNPFVFYEAIAKYGLENLSKDGFIAVEINSALGKETQEVFLKSGYKNVKLIQDFFEKDRFILAKK